jgi:hypothetical protein
MKRFFFFSRWFTSNASCFFERIFFLIDCLQEIATQLLVSPNQRPRGPGTAFVTPMIYGKLLASLPLNNSF